MPEPKLQPLPMVEAQAFWADKVQMSPGEFYRLADTAKIRAFAVSGIAKGDELNSVFKALARAIENGTTLDDFKQECAATFERRGWTGRRTWRVDNIFRTNIQTAYSVGHYRYLQDNIDLFEIWMYSAINDSRTRPTHLAMHRRAWPGNHPIWKIWFPPNGYRCRCSVIGMTLAQALRRGVKVDTVDPTNTLIEPIDPRTGNRLPARQLLADPGFNTNPGEVYWDGPGGIYADRLERWVTDLRTPALQEMISGPVFADWYTEPKGIYPVGVLSVEAAAAVGATSPVVRMSASAAQQQARRFPELGAVDYAAVQAAIAKGTPIRIYEDTVIYLHESQAHIDLVQITTTNGIMYMESWRRVSRSAAESDAEIIRLKAMRGETL